MTGVLCWGGGRMKTVVASSAAAVQAVNPFPEVGPVPTSLLEMLGPVTFGIAEAERAQGATDWEVLPPQLTRRPPEWVVNISQRLDHMILGELFRWRAERFSWHLAGRVTGCLNRFLAFIEHDLPRLIENACLPEVPESRWGEVETKISVEPLRPLVVRRLGREVRPDEDTLDLSMENGERWLTGVHGLVEWLSRAASRQKPEDCQAFLAGQLAGYAAVVDAQGNFTGQTPRTETYLELLVLWPAIEQLRQRQPPITREELYGWLVCQGVWCKAPGLDWFHDLCDDLKLGTKGRGRPRKRK